MSKVACLYALRDEVLGILSPLLPHKIEGIGQGARDVRKLGLISAYRAKQIVELGAAYNIVRRIDQHHSRDFTDKLLDELEAYGASRPPPPPPPPLEPSLEGYACGLC